MKDRLLTMIREAKDHLSQDPSFAEDREVRSSYVALLTVEGAVIFGDIVEFGDICVEFCRAKEREATESN